LVLFLGLRWVIYGSIGWLAGQFFAPFLVAGMLPGNLIQDGDAVLHEGSWTRPETFHRGDLVVYRVGGSRYAQPGYVVPEGFGLDRVVGVPGDDVQLKEGRLLVNGQPPGPEQMPLGKVSPLVDFAFRVENGQYAIVPSRLDLAIHGTVQAAPILQQIALVSDNDVLGRVVLRLRPWSRFGRIQ
jgi:signal peptidase I